jgi:two-component system response regulator RegX3
MDKILIFSEDDAAAGLLSVILQREHFFPILVNSLESALQTICTLEPDVLIIDVPCAAFAPAEICMRLQKCHINKPTIILGDSGEEMDKVLALEAGADDFIMKPFASRELVARVRALLRRRRSNLDPVIRFGNIEVDRRRLIVTCHGQEVKMTGFEYKLLLFFLGNVDLSLSRQMLMSSLWGYSDESNSRTLDTHVSKLRRKFEPDPSTPRHFLTIQRVGYRFQR